MDEKGIIKFACNWTKSKPLHDEQIKELNKWRNILYQLRLVGADSNNVGYGNLSIRFDNKTFIITGTATGKIKTLQSKHYTLVTNYNFEDNSLKCTGPVQASSESLTHAAIYEVCNQIKAVIHFHSKELWKKYINKFPTTAPEIEYGTIQMVNEIYRLSGKKGFFKEGIVVMAGHESGIITFGKDIDEAGNYVLKL
jgi:L-ribulose-5-phosphate 4-epimerase